METQDQFTAPVKDMEKKIAQFDRRIEDLKIQYHLFFSGELKLPPEKERTDLEKAIMGLGSFGSKSPRLTLLVQNLISKFSVFNNVWMKKLSELEAGTISIKKTKAGAAPKKAVAQGERAAKKGGEALSHDLPVNVNDEHTFDVFYQRYQEIMKKASLPAAAKEKIISALKAQMLINNMPAGKIELSMKKGKINLRLKQ